MKKIVAIIGIIAVVALGYYLYVTSPIAAPTKNVQEVSDILQPVSSSNTMLYRISQEKSQTSFSLNELLYGKPKLVIGTTTQIAGDLGLTGSSLHVGPIKIDARTFVTDNEKRNNAINRAILKTGTEGNEYIVFTPTVNDFTENFAPGKSVSFAVTGDLMISGITKPAVFKVTAMISDTTITGTAETIVKRSDFNLTVPNLSFLANIDDEVVLTANIFADKVTR